MQPQLRCIASHPRATSKSPTENVFSARFPRLITAAQDLLVDHATSTNAIRSTTRLPTNIARLVYIGTPPTVLAFLDNGYVVAYEEAPSGLRLVRQRSITSADRPVTLAHGALFGSIALFCKSDSPSVWCLQVSASERLPDPFKLRSDLEGDQQRVNIFDGTVAKLRGKVATKQTSRVSPVLSLASHPTLPLVAAAYRNGIIRVWDVNRKEQRSHFDVQLLLAEVIVTVAFHPTYSVIVACTTHGRIISFTIKQDVYKRAEDPSLATSKTRVRKRRFRAMCFSHSNPSYLYLLTASKRIITRVVTRTGVLLLSSRFPKSSRPLTVRDDAVITSEFNSPFDDFEDASVGEGEFATFLCDPVCGLMACSLDNSGNIYLFQRMVDGFPCLRSPLSSGLDLPLSEVTGEKFTGAVEVSTESLVIFDNSLFVYTLGLEKIVKVGRLPAGDIRSVVTARNEHGYCIGALVFYYGDDAVDSTEYSDPQEPARFLLCTKRGAGDEWNISEPSEGRSGCFLNHVGKHDRVLILSDSGETISISSFAGLPTANGQTKLHRGVQRFKLSTGQVGGAFRAPFASWLSVLYHNTRDNCVAISKNTFDAYRRSSSLSESYAMDMDTAMPLQDNEAVLDVRWQRIPGDSKVDEDYIGAIMTERRIYFVRHVLQRISRYEFNSIARMVVPFVSPSMSWAGPSILLLYGNSLFSVSVDGRSDFLAGLSNGECATTLVTCLADRVVYAAPSYVEKSGSICVRSRPFGGMSSFLRGMLSFPRSRRADENSYGALVGKIVAQHDVSQGSPVLMDCLVSKRMSPMAYMIVTSPSGKFVMPAIRRAIFLTRMGDIRGALTVAESEYAHLPGGNDFHQGTELFRLVQRIFNVGFIIGDYEVCRRCSTLLGRRGTMLSFIESEGGLEALRAVMDNVRRSGNKAFFDRLKLIADRSASSSVASEIGMIPSQKELYDLRQGIASMQANKVMLGSTDRRQVFFKVVVQPEDEVKRGTASVIANRLELHPAKAKNISERLEMWRHSAVADIGDTGINESIVDYGTYVEEGDDQSSNAGRAPEMPTTASGEKKVSDSSDDGITQGAKTNKDAGPSNAKLEEAVAHEQSASAIEGMLPGGSGQLTQMTIEGAADTEMQLEYQIQASKAATRHVAQSTHELAETQRYVQPSGAAVPEVKATELLQRACGKLSTNSISSAQKDIENGIRAISRGVERGVPITASLLTQLVQYRFACRLQQAMSEIAESDHANHIAGRMTYAQLATAETTLSLQALDRVAALIRVGDANMTLGNFATAARALKMIKDIGVPDGKREALRQRYAVCQTRGFVDAVHMPPRLICYLTLKAITPGTGLLTCSACVAVYAADSGVAIDSTCEYCQMGRIRIR